MGISFLFSFAFHFSSFLSYFKSSSDNHFVFLHFFFLGMFLITASCTSIHSSSGTLKNYSKSLPSGSFHNPLFLTHQRADRIQTHNHRKLIKMITWTTALSNSMKLWAMACRATHDGGVIVGSSDKMWSTGEGNCKPLQNSCLENSMNSMKRQKNSTLQDELPRFVGVQYATGEECICNSRKNEEKEPKWNVQLWMGLVMEAKFDVIKTDKLEVVKQEMTRVNINILGISELTLTGGVNLIQITIISTTVGRIP